MAVDAALMDRARTTGETVLRVYTWSAPTLSFGRHQRVRGLYDAERLRAAGVDVVRRPTGGRAILHHRELTYSVTAPERENESLRSTYARINGMLLSALSRLGVHATLAAPAARARIPDGAPCFEEPAAGELEVAGRKLVGSAQLRESGALLQHGSILVDDDQPLVSSLAERAIPVAPAPATLREILGRAAEPSELAEAFASAMRELDGESPTPLPLDDAALERSLPASRAHMASEAWIWSR
jgi:lipoate-protein ligase A